MEEEEDLVRKAVLNDVPAIHSLIEASASKGMMLHSSTADISAKIRDFIVYEIDDKIVGTCALRIWSEDIGEVISLTVKEHYTGKGIGRSLVSRCLDDARSLGLKKLFALTYKTGFFHKLGFRSVNKEVLPHKIWGDCIRCIKFPNCDENAVIIELK